MRKFKCQICGSKRLGYRKYASCISPIVFKKGNYIEYKQSIYDEDDYIAAANGFICLACDNLIEYCGCRMETERELTIFL